MIPLKSDNPRVSFAVVNAILIAVNILIFMYQFSLGPKEDQRLVNTYGVVPARAELLVSPTPGHHVTPPQVAETLVTSMFLHGGWLHVLGNMLFLWVFGGSVEDRLGHFTYFLFYMVCGVGSGLFHTIINWGSKIPTIGASGAISGVMGAYIVLFPRSRILTLIPVFIIFFTVRLPAILILGYWFILQFLSGVGSLGVTDQGGVAWWAHVGGFLLGALLVLGHRGPRSKPVQV
jgi:membrane associated rhomboid family serine protease